MTATIQARLDPMSESGRRPRIFVHIGTHKTGTTSFQHWLTQNEVELHGRFGLGVYHGAFPNNREIGLACARPDRSLPTRGIPQWVEPEWRRHVNQLVATELSRSEDLILSSEALSFLRHMDEVEHLARILANREVLILVALRQPEGFLRSWGEHLTRDGYRLSNDPDSFAYVGADSWLADYSSLLHPYKAVFGEARVRAIDYETAIHGFGSIIPALMGEIVGVDAVIPEWRTTHRNVGHEVEQARKDPAGRLHRRLGRLIRHPLSTSRRVVARWLKSENT